MGSSSSARNSLRWKQLEKKETGQLSPKDFQKRQRQTRHRCSTSVYSSRKPNCLPLKKKQTTNKGTFRRQSSPRTDPNRVTAKVSLSLHNPLQSTVEFLQFFFFLYIGRLLLGRDPHPDPVLWGRDPPIGKEPGSVVVKRPTCAVGGRRPPSRCGCPVGCRRCVRRRRRCAAAAAGGSRATPAAAARRRRRAGPAACAPPRN